jgi:hypothetical protein
VKATVNAQFLSKFLSVFDGKGFQTVSFAKLVYNIGNGYVESGKYFQAPKEGIYKFSIGMYVAGSRSTVSLATVPGMYVKSIVYFKPPTTASLTTTAVLKKGERVAAVYGMESAPTLTGDIDQLSPALNEFSGELMWELCDGKEC